ncbi:MAG: hypothetical protein KGD57_02550 [Candidatus Lokiarchaeota archaeon]|nr:hypothetical protein [Candidatus Lokiarchaeota archaeon]
MAKKRSRTKRGFLKNIIITFESKQAIIWKVYSERVEKITIIKLNKKYEYTEKKQIYHYFENIINDIRDFIQKGLRSILIINPIKKQYNNDFLNHIKSHQKWLLDKKNPNSISIRTLIGSIKNSDDIVELINSKQYNEAVKSATTDEDDQIIGILEKRLHNTKDGLVLYSLNEIEDLIYRGGKKKKKFKPLKLNPEYLILTTNYLNNHRQKNRLHHLLQIVRNREIKTKIINSENPSGIFIDSLGGITCFLKVKSDYEKKLGDQILQRKK